MSSVTTRPWDDDDLLAEAARAARQVGPVPEGVRRAGRTAFRWRAADTGRTLARMRYDSVLDDELQLRAGEQGGPRIVTFEADSLSVEIELTDDQVVGQLVPPTAGEVRLVAVAGTASETTADAMGCFVLPRPAPGPVRFHCMVGDQTVVTDWVRL